VTVNKAAFFDWAYGDLLSNATRGVLAEYIVHTALECEAEKRIEWASYDLLTSTGLRIEVKSAAYVQAWIQKRPSRISYSIRKARFWDQETNVIGDTLARNADVYVFCLLGTPEQYAPDPLDLMNWRFLVVGSALIESELGEQKTVTKSRLDQLGLWVMYEDLRMEIKRVSVALDPR
jgi:hypothetical protein